MTRLTRYGLCLVTQFFCLMVLLLGPPAQAVTSIGFEVTNGAGNDTVAIQAAITAGNDVLNFGPGYWDLQTSVVIPDGRNITFLGAGYRNTTFQVVPGIAGIKYNRVGSGSTLTVKDIAFVENGLGKFSTAIEFKGKAGAPDNWLRVSDCQFLGFWRAFDMAYAGQCHFIGVYAQYNNLVYYFGDDVAFVYMQRCMALDNGTMLYAEEPVAARSNGLVMNQCNSVLGTGTDVRINGWQAVFINQCGFDLGNGGEAAIYLANCQDYHITSSWIASDSATSATRAGIKLQYANHSGSITDNTFVNHRRGIWSIGDPAYASKLSIHGNKFQRNKDNHIYFEAGRAIKITNNSFQTTITRSGTNAEIYGQPANSGYNLVSLNSFRGTSYSISLGTGSISPNNIFGVPVE